MYLSNNVLKARIPYGIIFLTISIALLGMANLHSASQMTRPNLYLVQGVWLIAGIFFGILICLVRTDTLKSLSTFVYLGTLFLLLLVLVIGVTVKGSQRWINLGFFKLQPSELAKVSMILISARFFSSFNVKNGIRLRDLFRPFNFSRPIVYFCGMIFAFSTKNALSQSEWVSSGSATSIIAAVVAVIVGLLWVFVAVLQLSEEGFSFKQLIAPIDVVLVPFLLVLVEPDLGTSLVILAIAGSVILFCGLRRSSLLIAMFSSVALIFFAWFAVLKDYQKQRIETFMNPESDIHGHGYHAAQSIIAIGSGQFIGKGFGGGTQTQLSFLPENQTDFVFSVLAEEWGFLGASFVLLLYFMLLYQMIQVGMRVQDRFGSLLAVGAAMMVFWHLLINAGMVMGLLPVVGLTLPLMSYGGASMLTQIIAIALVVNVSVWRKT